MVIVYVMEVREDTLLVKFLILVEMFLINGQWTSFLWKNNIGKRVLIGRVYNPVF